ncbi:hypothetical protein CYLTODRAFT_361645 [Cylindrobasidium torrendii FP15055 ss-10]|uniref:cAMP-independent regulatory protein pac2 n=1 Tax=Cylindrobasidium torrendii FP15055 ss-10 TaxID=1314674 RepID=A0A0D7AWH5_9AGAR|nr:hypothetical protein CYLTODRAFT_361645 [Cylindrobasidium torrendii FP15055 ss-10]
MHHHSSAPSVRQGPTHPRLHLRDARDAHTLFEAVRQGFLQPITRRLNEAERAAYIRSGSVFVWEERDDESGLKRWTDGRLWGQSRMREPYLFYDEKMTSGHSKSSDTPRATAYRFVEGATRSTPSSSALLHQDRSGGAHNGLVKQSYSAYVQLSPTSAQCKWHVTAYFSYADLPHIPTISDSESLLSTIIVPSGIYRNSKSKKGSAYDSSTPSPGSSPSSVCATLPPLMTAVGGFGGLTLPRPQCSYQGRMREDQRVIHILNSKHVS